MRADAVHVACCLWLTLSVSAQEPPQRRSWKQVQRSLSAADTSIDARIALVERFVAERDGDPVASRAADALAARLTLAALHLRRFDADRAGAEFEITAELAPIRAVDVRGRALFGLAQALELTGDVTRARPIYIRITKELGGTRYADFARVALDRVNRPDAERPRAGQRAPEYGPALDRNGASHLLADLRGQTVLLCFADPSDPNARSRLAAVVEAAAAAGLRTDAMVMFVTTADDRDVRALIADPRFRMPVVPVVPADGGSLSRTFLLYEIRSVPSTVLIGPDGTILGRDLPPSRLRAVLESLRQ